MDDEGKTRWRPGCLGWVLIVTCIIGIAVVVTAFWIRTTSDLDAQRKRAVDLGLPMVWDGLDGQDGEDARIMRDAAAMTSRPRIYDGPYGYMGHEPFTPVPTEVTCWQLAGGSGVDALIDGYIERLSGEPSTGFDVIAVSGAIAQRDAVRLCGSLFVDGRDDLRDHLRMRVNAGIDDPARLASLIERLATSQPCPTAYCQCLSQRLIGLWCAQVQRRRQELDDHTVAATALVLADKLDATMSQVVVCHPLILDTQLRLPAEPVFRAFNVRLPAVMVIGDGAFMGLFYRLGRGPILSRAVTTADWCRRHGVPRTCVEVLAASPPWPRMSILSYPRDLLSSMMDQGWCQHCRAGEQASFMHVVMMEQLRTTTRLRLIAADLLGEPWPVDPGDPAGGRLREIRRGDHMIGAYSIGPNGVDDGGDIRNDWCWPLREQLGPRKASDTPYAP